ITATHNQKAINIRGEWMFVKIATPEATIPKPPTNIMMGDSARRYNAERSIKVRIVCRLSSALWLSIPVHFAMQSAILQAGFPEAISPQLNRSDDKFASHITLPQSSESFRRICQWQNGINNR